MAHLAARHLHPLERVLTRAAPVPWDDAAAAVVATGPDVTDLACRGLAVTAERL